MDNKNNIDTKILNQNDWYSVDRDSPTDQCT